MINLPLNIIVIVITWLLSAAVTFGVLKTKLDNLENRIGDIEMKLVPRPEYESGRSDVVNRLARIENKIDRLS